MAPPAHHLYCRQVRIGIRRPRLQRPNGNARCSHRERPMSESHFLFAVSAYLASLDWTALGMPSPNWLTVRISFPLEKAISRNFSLCIGFPYSSLICATIFFVLTSTTSPEESRAYCPSTPMVIQSAEAVVGKLILSTGHSAVLS